MRVRMAIIYTQPASAAPAARPQLDHANSGVLGKDLRVMDHKAVDQWLLTHHLNLADHEHCQKLTETTPDEKQGMNCAEPTKEQYTSSDIYCYMDSQQQPPLKTPAPPL